MPGRRNRVPPPIAMALLLVGEIGGFDDVLGAVAQDAPEDVPAGSSLAEDREPVVARWFIVRASRSTHPPARQPARTRRRGEDPAPRLPPPAPLPTITTSYSVPHLGEARSS